MAEITTEEVDDVSAGLVLIIIGLTLILLAPTISDFFSIPGEITGYEDKITRIPHSIHPAMFIVLGVFIVIIGCALSLRNFIHMAVTTLLHKKDNNNTL